MEPENNEPKRNETQRDETKWNEVKRTEMQRSKTTQNNKTTKKNRKNWCHVTKTNVIKRLADNVTNREPIAVGPKSRT